MEIRDVQEPSELVSVSEPRLSAPRVKLPPVIAVLVLTPAWRVRSSTPPVTPPAPSAIKLPANATFPFASQPEKLKAYVPLSKLSLGPDAAIVMLSALSAGCVV